jgi:hypothetical protein
MGIKDADIFVIIRGGKAAVFEKFLCTLPERNQTVTRSAGAESN